MELTAGSMIKPIHCLVIDVSIPSMLSTSSSALNVTSWCIFRLSVARAPNQIQLTMVTMINRSKVRVKLNLGCFEDSVERVDP